MYATGIASNNTSDIYLALIYRVGARVGNGYRATICTQLHGRCGIGLTNQARNIHMALVGRNRRSLELNLGVVCTARNRCCTNICRQSRQEVAATKVLECHELTLCIECDAINLCSVADTKERMLRLQALDNLAITIEFALKWILLGTDRYPILNLGHLDIAHKCRDTVDMPLRHICAFVPSLRKGLEALACHNTFHNIIHLLHYRQRHICCTRQHRQRNLAGTNNAGIAWVAVKRKHIRYSLIAICALLNRNPRWSYNLLHGLCRYTHLERLGILRCNQEVTLLVIIDIRTILPYIEYSIGIVIRRSYEVQLAKAGSIRILDPRDCNLGGGDAIDSCRGPLCTANPAVIIEVPLDTLESLHGCSNRRCAIQCSCINLIKEEYITAVIYSKFRHRKLSCLECDIGCLSCIKRVICIHLNRERATTSVLLLDNLAPLLVRYRCPIDTLDIECNIYHNLLTYGWEVQGIYFGSIHAERNLDITDICHLRCLGKISGSTAHK